MNIISGYGAKNMCSCMFEANRSQELIEATDNNFPPIDIAKYEVDTINKRVTGSVFGLMKRTAVYHEDLGCQLLQKSTSEPTINYFPVPHNCPDEAPYPYGNEEQKDSIFPNIDYDKLLRAVEKSFDDEGVDSLKTRSLLVLYKDQIIAEKYASNFNKKSVLLGWSMTKSVTATLFGVLEKQGKIDINATHLFPEWSTDERASITLNGLLQMSSGLEWEENYDEISDVTQMLFLDEDMSQMQLNKPLQFELNKHWIYSSGTTNLLSGYLRKQFETHEAYLDFPVKQLYDKLGMSSMMIETDLSGNYVGSSYGWATTRDWGKLGLLYLHNGNWNGEQIINESWVDYVSKPNGNSNGLYGAHFWLNAGGRRPDVPLDMYAMEGYQGQMVFIIPSKEMVIVRMGLTEEPDFDFNHLLKEIFVAVK
ncbi:MAG: serine hydrolase [Bacteroidales bacterium]|nr:serine hydrolase [Bacteroidales bacterium]